jgi:hypothetical protein
VSPTAPDAAGAVGPAIAASARRAMAATVEAAADTGNRAFIGRLPK